MIPLSLDSKGDQVEDKSNGFGFGLKIPKVLSDLGISTDKQAKEDSNQKQKQKQQLNQFNKDNRKNEHLIPRKYVYDHLEHCILQYNLATKWRTDAHYSSLLSESHEILDFSVPDTLSITLGKVISANLNASYSVGLPNSYSAGFLYTNIDITHPQNWKDPFGLKSSIKDQHDYISTLSRLPRTKGAVGIYLANSTQGLDPTHHHANAPMMALSENKHVRPRLFYGKIFEDFTVEALYSIMLASNWNCTLSSISETRTPHNKKPYLRAGARLQHIGKSFRNEFSFSTLDNTFMYSTLYAKKDSKWSSGLEVAYTGKSNGGGVSLGIKYSSIGNNINFPPNINHNNHKKQQKTAHPDLTTPLFSKYRPVFFALVANPIMGHVSANYTTHIDDRIKFTTSYYMNLFSNDSDVGFGIQYREPHTNSALSAMWERSSGLKLRWSSDYRDAFISLGFGMSFRPNLTKFMGVEINF